MTEHGTMAVKPLGVFGPQFGQAWELSAQWLGDLKDALDGDIRQRVARYLGAGTLIVPLMKYTTDVLGGVFGVSGGSGIVSDGSYYWRRDAAEYVLHYGIDVGAEAVTHMRSSNWIPPELSQKQVLEIDGYLARILRGSH